MGAHNHSKTVSNGVLEALHATLLLLAQAQTLLDQIVSDQAASRISLSADERDPPDLAGLATDNEIHGSVAESARKIPRGRSYANAPLEARSAAEIDRTRQGNIFESFETHEERFTPAQWVVVALYYRDGLTEEQIAAVLKISRIAVYDRRRRAKQRKAECERELRAEKVKLMRFLANP